MEQSFTKLFSSITESSLWVQQPSHVRVVWVTMLAMADRHGRINASIPGLAARAVVSIQETEHALEVFRSPDPYSRTREHEGRRIVDIDGGWMLLNYEKHRGIQSIEAERESKRRWAREHRAKAANVDCVDESRVSPSLSTSASLSDLDPEGDPGEVAELDPHECPTEPPPCDPVSDAVVQANAGANASPEVLAETRRRIDEGNRTEATRARARGGHFPPSDLEMTNAQEARCAERAINPDDVLRSYKVTEFQREYDWGRRLSKFIEDYWPRPSSARGAAGAGALKITSKHRAYAKRYALDVDKRAAEFVERRLHEGRTEHEAGERFGQYLSQCKREQRAEQAGASA
jgi:hypothetical protein